LYEEKARALGRVHEDIVGLLRFFVQFALRFAINAA
jgi:hypothetical protein